MTRGLLSTLPLLLIALTSSTAWGQGWDPRVEGGEVFVVQERPVRLRHEFAFGTGVLPLDAFYTGYTANAAYTFHASDILAWEVASVFISQNIDSSLRETLLEKYAVQPTRFETIEAGAFSHLTFKPFYGKRALMNGTVLTAETGFLIGAGVLKYSQSLRAALDVGILFHLHLADWFGLRFEIRDMLPVDIGGSVENVLHVVLSASFNFGSHPK